MKPDETKCSKIKYDNSVIEIVSFATVSQQRKKIKVLFI